MPDDLDFTRLADEVAARLIDQSGPRVSFTQLARDWQPGEIHEQGAVVSHQGGIWQARVRTASRPSAETGEWLLLTNGIRLVRSYQERDDPRVFGLLIGLTGGRTIDLPFRLALPVHRGQYRAGAHYFEGDEVEFGGATFRALIEAPGAPDGEGWIVVAARGRQGFTGERGPQGEIGPAGERGEQGSSGPAGARGEPGEPGERGPGIAAIEPVAGNPGFIRVVLDDGSISDPIAVSTMRFVGLYRPGAEYERGDIVRLGFNLWICVESTGDVPTATSDKWTIFLVAPEMAIGGAGGGAPDLPTLDARYLRLIGGLANPMTGAIHFVGDSLGISWNAGAAVYLNSATGGLVLRRDPANVPVMIEDGQGDQASQRRILTEDDLPGMGGAFLPLGGGTMTGVILFAPDQGFAFQPGISAILETVDGLTLRQANGDRGVFIEGAGGVPGSRRRILVEGDALTGADADNRYLQNVGGSLLGELVFVTPDGNPDAPAQPGVTFSARSARIYWDIAGLIIRRGTANEPVVIENNNGTARSPIITQAMGDARYLQLAAGGIVAGPMQLLQTPILPTDVVTKGYVDTTASTPITLRTQVYMPDEFAIAAPSTATVFFDQDFQLPPTGIRMLLITVDPMFASADAAGTPWYVVYGCNLIAIESSMMVYKMDNTSPAGMLRSQAKFAVGVDATPGLVRVTLTVRCPTVGSPVVQVGVGGTIAPTMRTLVTIQDLGPP